MGKGLRKVLVASALSVVGGIAAAAPAVLVGADAAAALSVRPAGPVLKSLPEASAAEEQMLTLLNGFRAQNGLKSLVRIPTLDSAARDWSTFMAGGGCLNREPYTALCHRTDLAVVATLASPKGWTRAGENVGRVPDGGTIEALHEAFVGSSSHRANMLTGSYNAVGVGVTISDEGMLYITFEFIATIGTPNSSGPVVGFPKQPEGLSEEDAFVFYVNYIREQAGLQSVTRQVVLDREATWWSDQRMNGVCGEDRDLCLRRDSAAMIRAAVGSGRSRWWGSTVAATFATDASAQVAGLANSSTARKMLMRPQANLIGVGITTNEDGYKYITITMIQSRYPTKTLPASANNPQSSNECGWVQSTLRFRSKGVAVRVAQCALAGQGLWAGELDGYYSVDMTNAVKEFQRLNNLRATGKLDVKTRRVLGVV